MGTSVLGLNDSPAPQPDVLFVTLVQTLNMRRSPSRGMKMLAESTTLCVPVPWLLL
jgi:hypothetical protein